MEKNEHIKVVHIIGGGEFGGAEQHVLHLAKRLQKSGFDVSVVCLFPAPFYGILKDEGIPALAVPMSHRLDLGAFFRLSSSLKHLQPHVVHTHGVRANLVGRLAARLSGVPAVVTTVHSVLALDYPSAFSRFANNLTERATSRLTSRFIAVSGYIKDYLAASGIPPSKISVIYNGIDFDGLQRQAGDSTFRLECGIAPDAPLFGIIARLHPVKGHRYFLEAARDVAGEFPDARFAIVGSGFYYQEIDRLIREHDLEQNCVRTGFRKDVGQIYAALDCLVISSLSEGFGLTAVEALALGRPVVATRVGALPEIVSDGVSGFLVPPADSKALAEAMIRILNLPDRGRSLGEAGRAIVQERFSLDHLAEETARLYRSLV